MLRLSISLSFILVCIFFLWTRWYTRQIKNYRRLSLLIYQSSSFAPLIDTTVLVTLLKAGSTNRLYLMRKVKLINLKLQWPEAFWKTEDKQKLNLYKQSITQLYSRTSPIIYNYIWFFINCIAPLASRKSSQMIFFN